MWAYALSNRANMHLVIYYFFLKRVIGKPSASVRGRFAGICEKMPADAV